MPIVFIAGSRGFRSPQRVRAWVRKLAAKYPDAVVVSGGARKVEALRGALKAVPARVLITDQAAATALLQ